MSTHEVSTILAFIITSGIVAALGFLVICFMLGHAKVKKEDWDSIRYFEIARSEPVSATFAQPPPLPNEIVAPPANEESTIKTPEPQPVIDPKLVEDCVNALRAVGGKKKESKLEVSQLFERHPEIQSPEEFLFKYFEEKRNAN